MSQDKKEKVFVGSTRVKDGKYGQIVNVGFSQKDIDLLSSNLNDRGWVNINLLSKRDGGMYAELEQKKPAPGAAANTQDDDLF